MVKVTCLGGTGTVTGSCYLLENTSGSMVLVDCGMFQGGPQIESRNHEDWGFDPSQITMLLVTHAHIDHSGRIPKLVKDGFRGKIVTSPPTAELCEIMLLDAAHIQEMDAEWQTRKNKRQGKGVIEPLYTTEDAQESLKYFSPVERDQMVAVEPGIRARLRNAGHILGSSVLELWIADGNEEVKIVFSGDLGKKNQLIIKDPHEIFAADYLFLESTYGDRLHRSFDDSKKELLEAINYAVSHEEKILIPAFAVERTQELLYVLGEFHRDGTLPDIPIYLDSPLAIKATEIFRKNKKYYDEEAMAIVNQGFDPFDLPTLRFTPSTRESMAINDASGSAIIIAGSGMATAGRIKHHLKHNLWRPGTSVVIVGFQAQGTTGRQIVDGAKAVKIFRENVAVKARVFTIGGFSAHADQNDLLEWAGNFATAGPRVFLVHGEPKASQTLAAAIQERYTLEVYIPRWRETLIMKPKEPVKEVVPEEVPLPDVRQTMLSMVGDLEENLQRLRHQLQEMSPTARSKDADLERLKCIQDELNLMLSE